MSSNFFTSTGHNQVLPQVNQENPAAYTKALEREIVELIYGLYGLTKEEVGIIEK